MACTGRLVRDIISTLNGGQFRELSDLFSVEAKPLYFHMTVEQVVDNEDAILHEHTGLLMRVFLSALKVEAAIRSEKRQKREEDVVGEEHATKGTATQGSKSHDSCLTRWLLLLPSSTGCGPSR